MKIRKEEVRKNFITFKSLGIMFSLCVCALLYVWQNIVIVRLGYQIKNCEVKLEKLTDEKVRLESVISKMESPENIEKLLADANIKLEYSKNPNVVRLKKI